MKKKKKGGKLKKRKYLMRIVFCGNPNCFSASCSHAFDPAVDEKCFCGRKRFAALLQVFQRHGKIIIEKTLEGGEAFKVVRRKPKK